MGEFIRSQVIRERLENALLSEPETEREQFHREAGTLWDNLKILIKEKYETAKQKGGAEELERKIQQRLREVNADLMGYNQKTRAEWLNSIEYVLIFYKEGTKIIYTRASLGIQADTAFVEDVRRTIELKGINVPNEDGAYLEGIYQEKFISLRSGRFDLIAVISSKKHHRFAREFLDALGIRFYGRFARELLIFNTELGGDTSVFGQRRAWGGNTDDMVELTFKWMNEGEEEN